MLLALYRAARAAGRRPALLDSAQSVAPGEGLSLLGVDGASLLEVRDGATWLDGERIGDPLEILRILETGLGEGHFPAWIGFFTYEFARHLGLPTRPPMPGLPEAVFVHYPRGWVFRDGALVEGPGPAGAALEAAARRELEAIAAVHDPSPPVGRAISAESPAIAARALARGGRPPGGRPIELRCDLPEAGFLAGVAAIQERIRAGEVYQVNLSSRFHHPARDLDPLELFARLRAINPSPFMGLFEGAGWALVSGSPERLFSLGPRDAEGLRTLTTRPIAGTRPRGEGAADEELEQELRASAKERAEHVMLVDLLRNDLARCSEAGTVEVVEAFTVERYSHVMHLVSEIRSRSRAPLAEIFASIFPGGTITGAPKASVMSSIAELEPVPRGPYTGSLGYVSGRGADFNILIRSVTFAGGEAFLSFGGGVVIESDPAREYAETQAKAQAALLALGQGKEGRAPSPPRLDSSWTPPRARRCHPEARVIFVENRDSFSFNVIDYLRTLGARVEVVPGTAAPALAGATHLVVGPGPGEPRSAGRLFDWIASAREEGVPLLGICLGHQALGLALGARLVRSPTPVHGQRALIRHSGAGIFAGLAAPAPFARYHSLALVDLPAEVEAHAWTEEGINMAISDRARRAWGVQFHPESILSTQGMELLSSFLELERR